MLLASSSLRCQPRSTALVVSASSRSKHLIVTLVWLSSSRTHAYRSIRSMFASVRAAVCSASRCSSSCANRGLLTKSSISASPLR